ncbi:MAG: hypothetical protein U1U88_001179 [Lawsonella clevelandensis]
MLAAAPLFHMWGSHWQWGPVWGVTYPGRDARLTEPMPAHVQALAAQVGEELAVHLRRHPLPTVRFSAIRWVPWWPMRPPSGCWPTACSGIRPARPLFSWW